MISGSIVGGRECRETLNKIFISGTEITMRKNYVVERRGYFEVIACPTYPFDELASPRARHFKSWRNAYRYFRYHVNTLGWRFGLLQFVENNVDAEYVLMTVKREV